MVSCDICGDNMIPVRNDNKYERTWVSGNPYSFVCEGCGHQKFTSEKYWEKADDRYIIPEGGEVADITHYFDCPKCDTGVEGYPDECPECGTPYAWDFD